MKPGLDERLRAIAPPDLWPEIERRLDRGQPRRVRSALRYAVPVAACLAILAVFAWGLVGLNRGFREGPPPPVTLTSPDGAAVAGLHANVKIVPDSEVSALLQTKGVAYGQVFAPIPGGTSVVIRLDWTKMPSAPARSTYAVVVMDESTTPAVPASVLWVFPTYKAQMGWDGRYNPIAARYPWLAPTADVCDSNGCTNPTTAQFIDPRDSGPIWIVARFPEVRAGGNQKAGPVPDPLIGVIYTDADVNLIWAKRLYG